MTQTSKIFLLDGDSTTRVIEEANYDGEKQLQEVIESNPDLIPGDQLDPNDPLRWILIKREAGIPETEGGSSRWSIDHVLIDHNAVPTFVECKLSGNPEARRKVVAQMLDYAANASAYWPDGRMREQAESTASAAGRDFESYMGSLITVSEENSIDNFWELADQKLREGRIRLLFVANKIPQSLQTIVDFLNGQMEITDVAAVEIRYFEAEGIRALVPRVTGRAPQERATIKNRERTKTTLDEIFESLPDGKFRTFARKITINLERIGVRAKPGSIGSSWRIKTPREISLAWLFPPGKNWSGINDLTLGVITESIDKIEQNKREILTRFGKAIVDAGGSQYDNSWLIGSRFDADSISESSGAILAAIEDLKNDLSNNLAKDI